MSAKLVWATPELDRHLAYIARVSNPHDQDKPVGNLFRYMMREGHASPFAMCNVCVEVVTARDIGRQMLRHWSIYSQEFSQRYADVRALRPSLVLREFRAKHPTNRQLSLEVPGDDPRHAQWDDLQREVAEAAERAYAWCLENGGAKEVARVVLPEGLTLSRLYFNGTMRSWIGYLKSRLHPSAQKEHRAVARQILTVLRKVAPATMDAFFAYEGDAHDPANCDAVAQPNP